MLIQHKAKFDTISYYIINYNATLKSNQLHISIKCMKLDQMRGQICRLSQAWLIVLHSVLPEHCRWLGSVPGLPPQKCRIYRQLSLLTLNLAALPPNHGNLYIEGASP